MGSHYEKAGGMPVIYAVIRDFYDAVFDDVMIGFHFRNADKARLIDKECELAAKMLGATHIQYTGEPLKKAHQKHPIFGGQFERRLKLLVDAMDAHGLPEDVKLVWIDHTNALREQVVQRPC